MTKSRKATTRLRGFTLAEALVAALVLAVLSAVTIPLLTGYIKDSRQRAVDELAQSAAAAADGYCRKTTMPPSSTADLNLHYDNSKYSVTVGASSVTVTLVGNNGVSKTINFR